MYCISWLYYNDRDGEELFIISGSTDVTVKIFDVEKGECKYTTIEYEYN